MFCYCLWGELCVVVVGLCLPMRVVCVFMLICMFVVVFGGVVCSVCLSVSVYMCLLRVCLYVCVFCFIVFCCVCVSPFACVMCIVDCCFFGGVVWLIV